MAAPGNPDPLQAEAQRLRQPLRGRRRIAWVLVLLVALLGIALPLLWPAPADDAPATARAGFDTVWNPGPLAAAHQPWASECKLCHAKPFSRVRDEDCRSCHRDVQDHVDRGRVHDAALDVRCATCHRDHQGSFALEEQNRHFVGKECGSCHGDIGAHHPETLTQNVSDFATAHPQFRVQKRSGIAADAALERVRLPAEGRLQEASALRFPHDVHLAAGGVGSPQGKRRMDCADCHTPDGTGESFLPVRMETHCQSCHSLAIEPALSGRELPHAPVPQVLDTLVEFYTFVARNGAPPDPVAATQGLRLLRPGREKETPSFVTRGADPLAMARVAATELVEKTACRVCHTPERVSGPGTAGTPGESLPQWRIPAVAPAHTWMPAARFSHAAHRSESCGSCHAATESTSAEDVLMPGIAHCRDCHAGSAPEPRKVSSDCGLCHGFHVVSGHAPVTAVSLETAP